MSSFAVTPNRLVLNAMLFMPAGKKKVWIREITSKGFEKVDEPGLSCQHHRAAKKRLHSQNPYKPRFEYIRIPPAGCRVKMRTHVTPLLLPLGSSYNSVLPILHPSLSIHANTSQFSTIAALISPRIAGTRTLCTTAPVVVSITWTLPYSLPSCACALSSLLADTSTARWGFWYLYKTPLSPVARPNEAMTSMLTGVLLMRRSESRWRLQMGVDERLISPASAGTREWPVRMVPDKEGAEVVKKKEDAIVDRLAATFLHLGNR